MPESSRRIPLGGVHLGVPDRGGHRRRRPRAVHLGHLRATPRPDRRRQHRRRRLRPLPPVRRGRRADGRARRLGVPVLDRLAPDPARPAPARPTRPAWTSTTGWWTTCSPPASTRSPRSSTGTCRSRWRTRGGWLSRDTAARFAEYADLVAARLGDRVKLWITLNEPFVHMTFGYGTGRARPGPDPAVRRVPGRPPPTARARAGGRRAARPDQQPGRHRQQLLAGPGGGRRHRRRPGRRRGVRRAAQPALHRPAARPGLPRRARPSTRPWCATATST